MEQISIFDFLEDEKILKLKRTDLLIKTFVDSVPYEFEESRSKSVFYKYKNFLILQFQEKYFDEQFNRYHVFYADSFIFSHEVQSLDHLVY